MSDTKHINVSGGIGLPGLVFLVFLILKLTGYIDWSWWYVTAPLWGGLAIVVGVLLLIVLVSGAAKFIGWLIERPKAWLRRKEIAKRHAAMVRERG